MKEIWRDIEGYEYYEISNMGRVWNKKSNIFLKASSASVSSVLRVSINGKRKLLHRLVADTFIINPENKPYVVFKNFRDNDPRACNLIRADQDELNLHIIRRDKVIPARRISNLSEEDLLKLSIDIEQGKDLMELAISYDINYIDVYFRIK